MATPLPRAAVLAVVLAVLAAVSMGCKRRAQEAPSAPAAPAVTADAAPQLSADYDPTALVQGGADAVSVYLKEPRNASWAGAVEEVVGGQLRRDLKKAVPEMRSLSMGCRTLSCLVIIDVPEDKRPVASVVLNLVTLGPITADLGLSPDGKGQLLFMTEPRFADPAAFTTWYKRTRARALEDIKTGKRPNPLPIPPTDLTD
jgi:hypothetical protein